MTRPHRLHAVYLLALMLGTAATVPAPKPVRALSVEPAGDPAVVERAFLDAAARSRHARSGDIYTLPQPYNYVVEREYSLPETSHFAAVGGPATLHHRGTSHSTAWRYDSRIPIVLYGPGRIRAGFRPTEAATQQDLPATYAALMQTTPPRDCRGRVLRSALLPAKSPPKAILTLVLDQGGRNLYRAHPDAYPNIRLLMAGGTDFLNAEVTHLETETALGHIAIGTGSYPDRSGIPSNFFFHGGHGAETYAFTVSEPHSPLFMESPTLGDHWLRRSGNQAIVASYCYSERAAMGMGGHGSYYQGNKPTLVWYYDTKTGHFATNPAYYQLPEYLKAFDTHDYAKRLTNGSGLWFGHEVGDPDPVRTTPALASMEGDALVSLIAHEPIGQDDVTDLLYCTLKSTDAAGHRYGFESDETGAVLREADAQVGRMVAALDAKVGAGNYVVAVTADHGGTPLPERSGGHRLIDGDLVARINAAFTPPPQSPVCLFATTSQIWLDPNVVSPAIRNRIVAFVRQLKVDGKPFYRLVLDAKPIEARRAQLIQQGRIY